MKAKAVMLGSILLLWSLAPGQAATSGSANDCLVTQASDAAIQRQISMIDAAKVNPSDFFSGASSCISPQLLQSFDLSRFIPDLASFLSGGVDGLLQNILSQVKNQVCSVLNQQLGNLVQKLNLSSLNFEGTLSSQMRSILGGSRSTTVPSWSGQYSFPSSSSYGSVFGSTTPTTTQAVLPAPAAYTSVPAAPPADTSTSSGVSFGSSLLGQ